MWLLDITTCLTKLLKIFTNKVANVGLRQVHDEFTKNCITFSKVDNTDFNVNLLGDIGQAMADGTIKIIDRKKDLVKLQMGEYVSLGKVESILKIHSVIDNICVCARPSESFTVALIVPDENKLKILASELLINQDISFEDMCMDYKVIAEVLRQVTAHGLQMGCEKFEIPKAITLIPEVWTPDSGLVTAAMKLVSFPNLLLRRCT